MPIDHNPRVGCTQFLNIAQSRISLIDQHDRHTEMCFECFQVLEVFHPDEANRVGPGFFIGRSACNGIFQGSNGHIRSGDDAEGII